ncbi:Gfo/Idh/MocA family oxidoreductase [Oceanobacillus polygoni]|uniref:Myo-inositol 2-dehydrogenase/D-chiro-inositol 1-dehydrogenase n=1 Tax=Oceanobacillus polygoni TaxID=1235259 RepID=A0A9X0YRL8_9BACI|nr:Gfo/Idh/MocA family oxidoreductase [Oceanobacillus polygoni]MBP2075974.1 myo-inositol 2-dehydrogenase/D-chiro-inositol 1-dehydrogenase [Oceanobacillus polygoni]
MRKLNIGLIGAGRMGAFHGETIANRIPNANLYAVADPVPGAAENLLDKLEVAAKTFADPTELIKDENIEAVVIASPARTHACNVLAAINQGKAVFCEKPMAINMEEANRILQAIEGNKNLVQVGFNRRFENGFRSAHEEIVAGKIGTPQLLRSNTRDPKLNRAESIQEWTIFLETLIHDFDTLMYLNPGAKPVEVYAIADALIRPDLKEKGLLDTAVVNIKFDNGAIATADANFQAVYGYDVRAEVFGSEGMLTTGGIRKSNMIRYNKNGASYDTCRYDQDLLFDAYVSELRSFTNSVISNEPTVVNAEDAVWALKIALASIDSVKMNCPIKVGEKTFV